MQEIETYRQRLTLFRCQSDLFQFLSTLFEFPSQFQSKGVDFCCILEHREDFSSVFFTAVDRGVGVKSASE